MILPSSPRKVAREARRKEFCGAKRCVKATNGAFFLGVRLLQSPSATAPSRREPRKLCILTNGFFKSGFVSKLNAVVFSTAFFHQQLDDKPRLIQSFANPKAPS